MNTTVDERMTAAEFLKKYGGYSGVELIRGRVVWAGGVGTAGGGRVPNFQHGVVCNTAARLIGEFVSANDLGWVATNDTFVQAGPDIDSVRGADVLFVSYAKVPKGRPPKDLDVPPDLVVEVRSPTDTNARLTTKVGEYLEAGVPVIVVLNPRLEAAVVHRPGDEIPQLLHNGDELTLPDVLPGFAVPVRKFFE